MDPPVPIDALVQETRQRSKYTIVGLGSKATPPATAEDHRGQRCQEPSPGKRGDPRNWSSLIRIHAVEFSGNLLLRPSVQARHTTVFRELTTPRPLSVEPSAVDWFPQGLFQISGLSNCKSGQKTEEEKPQKRKIRLKPLTTPRSFPLTVVLSYPPVEAFSNCD